MQEIIAEIVLRIQAKKITVVLETQLKTVLRTALKTIQEIQQEINSNVIKEEKRLISFSFILIYLSNFCQYLVYFLIQSYLLLWLLYPRKYV